jgi:hypothetical protein
MVPPAGISKDGTRSCFAVLLALVAGPWVVATRR